MIYKCLKSNEYETLNHFKLWVAVVHLPFEYKQPKGVNN